MNGSHLQLTVFLDETDTSGEMPLYEAVVRRLLHHGIAGATVLKGAMGYGRHGRVHRQRLFGVSDDKPVLVLAIDRDDKIRPHLGEIRALIHDGLITLTPVEIVG